MYLENTQPDIFLMGHMLGKNSPDSPLLMFYFLRENTLPYIRDVSGRMAQMTQFVS
jgi:hypothetical protein